MPKTRVMCPNCRQPLLVEVDQLFDVNSDPTAKQRFLTGSFNLIQCPYCKYQGSLATPIVYHDADKELLLTFVPPELGLSRDEQERAIGSLINQAISKLPQEKRKAYLFRPQSTLTLQGLLERVLEAEGITKEMIQEQQKRLSLLQRLASTADENVRKEIIQQEDSLIDGEFFSLIRRLAEAAMVSGDQNSTHKLAELQKVLLAESSFGRNLQNQAQEVEAAVNDLRSLGREITREKMLDLVQKAPNDTRLRALVSFARPVMDYVFFQMLSEKIDRARSDGRARLVELRTKLLEMTQEVDQQVEEHIREAQQAIQELLQAPNAAEAMAQNLGIVDEYFVRELNQSLEDARKQGDLEKSSKLQAMLQVIEQASTPPPEVALVQQYLELMDDQARQEFLSAHEKEISRGFVEVLTNLVAQTQASNNAELAEHIRAAHRVALRFSMERSLHAS